MTSDALKKALKAEPFQPFRLHMSNSRTLDVSHPEFVMVSPSGRTAAIYPGGEGDGLEIIDILLVQSIEFLTTRNRRRRRAG